jgi:hypothetical protein
MKRAANIAALARRYQVLAKRPDVLYPDDAEQRVDRAIAANLPPLDVFLVALADETDRACANGVRLLRETDDPKRERAILDELSVLGSDYLLAFYFALPPDRKAVAEGHPVWRYALDHQPKGIEFRLGDLAELAEAGRMDLIDGQPVDPEMFWSGEFTHEECIDFADFTRRSMHVLVAAQIEAAQRDADARRHEPGQGA